MYFLNVILYFLAKERRISLLFLLCQIDQISLNGFLNRPTPLHCWVRSFWWTCFLTNCFGRSNHLTSAGSLNRARNRLFTLSMFRLDFRFRSARTTLFTAVTWFSERLRTILPPGFGSTTTPSDCCSWRSVRKERGKEINRANWSELWWIVYVGFCFSLV